MRNEKLLKIDSQGWIPGIVEYQGCGSHSAEWLDQRMQRLILASLHMYQMLLEGYTDSELGELKTYVEDRNAPNRSS